MRKIIDELYDTFELEGCIDQCKKVLADLDLSEEENFGMIFFCYYKMSSSYSTLNQFNLALQYIKEAKKYITNETDRAKFNWAMSYCYYNYDNKLSLKYIQKSIDIFEKISPSASYYFEAQIHKAVLTNDEKLLINSIDQVKKLGREQIRIDELYVDLYFLYINKGNFLKAQLVISKIGSKKTRDSLKNHVETYAINYIKLNNGGKYDETDEYKTTETY